MSREWLRWRVPIDSYGKICFPKKAREYLSEIKRYRSPYDERGFIEIEDLITGRRTYQFLIFGDDRGVQRKARYDVLYNRVKGIHTENAIILSGRRIKIPVVSPTNIRKKFYMLGIIIQKKTFNQLKKGKYLLFCPYFALDILLPDIIDGLNLRETVFFYGFLTSFDKSNRIYIPTEFQEIIGIDQYKTVYNQKNIVIRPVNSKLSGNKNQPCYGYWLEIWNRKDLEK